MVALCIAPRQAVEKLPQPPKMAVTGRAMEGSALTSGQAVLVALALAATACGASLAQESFSRDFHCPEQRVKVEDLGDTRYRVSGCEEEAIYICFDECKLKRRTV